MIQRDVMISIDANPDQITFDITFHDGFQKRVVIDRYDLSAARCSLRDYAQNIVTDYLETNNLTIKDLRFVFY